MPSKASPRLGKRGRAKSTTEIGRSKKTPPLKQSIKSLRKFHKSYHLKHLLWFVGIVLLFAIAYEIGYTRRTLYAIPLNIVLEGHLANVRDQWKLMKANIPEILLFEPERPGVALKMGKTIPGLNVTAKYNVVLLPGIVTSKLELWEGKPCAASDFRLQYWGSTKMLQAMLLRKKCWLEHLALNQTTGLDPDGIKLRVAEGMGAADFLIGDYWVWDPVIHNLADIGYDPNSMVLAAYDWRLASTNLEKRDAFFSKLKMQIELMNRQKNEKTYIVGHSMGSIVSYFFLKWVESEHGGNGGPNWVNNNIEGFVNIAGPMLGVPKTMSALISGEMRDTAELNMVMEYIQENLISTTDLLKLFRSFSSLASMIPKGSNRIWGNETWAPEDNQDVKTAYDFSHGTFLDLLEQDKYIDWVGNTTNIPLISNILVDDDNMERVLKNCTADNIDILDKFPVELLSSVKPMTIETCLEFFKQIAPQYFEKISQHDSFGIARDFSSNEYDHPRYWNNPLESQLPNAPDMKIFSLYGIGKATERSYVYTSSEDCSAVPFRLARKLTNVPALVSAGIRMVDGDGTVPLISEGLMGVKGWKDPIYNPANITSITREYVHKPEILSAGGIFTNRLRGGKSTADHVDIMGNHELLRDILLIVSGNYEYVPDNIHSNIRELAETISFD